MDTTALAKQIFELTRSGIPGAVQMAKMAINQSRFSNMNPEELKGCFSDAVSELQVDAYHAYLKSEAASAGYALKKILLPIVGEDTKSVEAFDFLARNFQILDRFYLSLTQSRRSRAGSAFEVIVSELFSKLSYPYTAQPEIGGNRPDYVLPSKEWYTQYPTDCIIFTLKRTLRERWKQIVTESSSGRYYLATIDDAISAQGLVQMMKQNITLVVPANIKSEKYAASHNVISFESFFEHHLDPSMARWRSVGAI